MANRVRIEGEFADGISAKLNRVGQNFDKAVGKGSSASLFGNIGAKAVAGGFGLIDRAASGAIDLLGETFDIWQKIEQQEKALNIALQAHGSSLEKVRPQYEALITLGEQYGMKADDVRAAVLKLTQAGIEFTDIEAGLPAVMDLAIAKHISTAEAADIMARATTGQSRGLTDLGIKLTAASGQLVDLTKTTDVAAAKGKNFQAVAEAITGATGDQSGSIDALDKKQTVLANKWEKFATKIGPALETALSAIVDALSAIVDAISWVIDHLPDLQKTFAGSSLGSVAEQVRKEHHASGGWVGLHGPQLSMVGESGPEYITPNHGGSVGGGGMGVTIQGVSADELADIIDRKLYVRLQRAAPTALRS